MSFVRIRELRKTYDTGESRVTPLDGINLDIVAGEFLSLMGPSGSGKTTLLNIVAGIDRQTSGSVKVGDVELSRLSDAQLGRWRNRNMGYVFQQFNLVPVLTALENVELPLMLLPLSGRRRRRQAEIALAAVGLSDRLKHYPRQLSGGQQQRVAIARAVVTDPAIIAADEPTGNLDTATADEIFALIEHFNKDRGQTFLVVTHGEQIASRAHRTLRMKDGLFVT